MYEFFMHTLLSKISFDTALTLVVLAIINEYIRSMFLIFCIFLIPVDESKQEILSFGYRLANFLGSLKTQSKELNLFELFTISLTFRPQNHKKHQCTEMYYLGNRNQREKHEFHGKKPPPKQTLSHVTFISVWQYSTISLPSPSNMLIFSNFHLFLFFSSLYRHKTALLENMIMFLKRCILKFMLREKKKKSCVLCLCLCAMNRNIFFNYIIWNHIL